MQLGSDILGESISITMPLHLRRRRHGAVGQRVKASNTKMVNYSGDGETLAVGAHWESSGAMGIGGDQEQNEDDRGTVRCTSTDAKMDLVARFGIPAVLAILFALVGCSDRTAREGGSDGSGTDDDSSGTSTDDDSSSTSTDDESDTTTEEDSSETSTTDEPVLPEPPVLELSFSQIKQFDFTWSAVPEAEYYQLLESATADEPFVQLGSDIMGESISIMMPLHLRAHASYRLRACNADGCSESESVDVVSNLAEAVGYFKASNPDQLDYFGRTLALSADGDTLAVAASSESSSAMGIDGDQADDSASRSGAVYVFVRNGDTWSQQAYVKASNPEVQDHFGSSLALSANGDTLAVGATSESSGATGIDGDQTDNSAPQAGAVYVFARDGAEWSQQAYVKASNTEPSDAFGGAVALSVDGDTLAVGATGKDSSSGAVYVFVRDGSVWSQQAYLETDASDRFGSSVALAGDTLAVGAYFHDSATGAVYVFVRDGDLWSEQAYLQASNAESMDRFGADIALSSDGDTLAVGADDEDGGAMGIDGPNDNWSQESGAAYVFVRNGAEWSQQAYVKASNTEDADSFGFRVALSNDGDTMAVGAVREDSLAFGIDGDQASNAASESGAVYVFVREGDVWSQRAYVKASNTADGNLFASDVSLSGDGNILAVGAPHEHSVAMGIGGDQEQYDEIEGTGAVYLY